MALSPIPPLFLGPAEMLIVGLVLLVLLFGSKAPDMASRVGESIGTVSSKKEKIDQEIEELKGTPDHIKEDLGVDEDLEEIEEGIEDVEESLDPEATPGDDNPGDRMEP